MIIFFHPCISGTTAIGGVLMDWDFSGSDKKIPCSLGSFGWILFQACLANEV
jgi:hypothetical protein